nr:TRAP transporter large permease subunit [Mesorhizobium sp.]
MRALLERLDVLALALTERIAALGVLGILGIGIVTVADVLLRTLFNDPIDGLNEITSPLLAIGVAACLPAGAAGRVDITIDLAQNIVGRTAFAWLRVLGAATLLLFMTIVTVRLGLNAERMIELGRTSSILSFPIGALLMAVTGVFALTLPIQLLQVALFLSDAIALNRMAGIVTGAIAAAAIVGCIIFGEQVWAGVQQLFAMPSPQVALACFGLMWVLILLSVPIGGATGLAGLLGASLIIGAEPSLGMVGRLVEDMMYDDNLAVLPLFLLMGSFATVAGMSGDIYRLANTAVGHLRGGLAYATILGSAGFGALTGSSLATSATIGKVALPEMAQRNYDRSLAAGTVAAGGTLGQLVPPSTVIVVYALLTEESIGTLFIAALVPALLAVALYMAAIFLTVRFSNVAAPAGARQPLAEIGRSLLASWQVILLIGAVVGGLYSGLFTETEAASVGAVGAFCVSLARGRLRRDTIWQVMRETTTTVAILYVLIFGAVNFSFLVGISGVPDLFVAWMSSLSSEPIIIVLCIALLYLLLGTVMDTFAIMIITVPVFLPLIQQLGLDPIWWGILTVCLVETGMITPPFGLNLFILKSISRDLPLSEVYRGVWPFVVADIVKIGLLIAFPIIALWLPGTR